MNSVGEMMTRVQDRPIGSGAIVTEISSRELDYFTKTLFYKPEQDVTFSSRRVKTVTPLQAIENNGTINFTLERK